METRTLIPGFSSMPGTGGSTPSILRPRSTKAPSGVTDTTVPSTVPPSAWWDRSNWLRMSPKEVSTGVLSGVDASGVSGTFGWVIAGRVPLKRVPFIVSHSPMDQDAVGQILNHAGARTDDGRT